MNRTKRSLLICAVSLLLFVSLVITCFAVAASISSVWQGGVSSVLEGTGTEADPYRISRGDDLALFAQMVAGGETFEGKHVILCSDIDMGGSDVTDSDGKLMLYPIGFDADSSYIKGKHGVFSGIFDGRGHTISNIYQNVEQLRGVYNETQYNAAMGLFGHVEDATIKNLFLAGFTIGGADTDVGCVAAYASGECRFENISLVGCSAYTGDGSAAGIVGFDAAAQKGSASSFTFRNITIDASNSIGAVDGSWDVHVGGLVGYLSADSSVLMDNCHTAQKLGVNVSADGEYVGAGMLVGSVDKRNGTVLDTSLITAQDSSVYFIDATPTDHLLSGYGFGITPVRAGELDGVVTGTGTPYFYDKFVGQDREAVTNTTLTLGELFSSDVSAFAVNSEGVQIFVESVSGNAAVAYEQNTDDWSATTLSVTGLGSLKVTICDYYFCKTESAVLSVVEPTPTEKFTLKFPNTDTYLYRVGNGNAVTLGTLFGTLDGVSIDSQNVTVEIAKKNASMNVSGTVTANSTDWTKSTIQFTGRGVVTLTITDNDYCIAKTLELEVVDATNATGAMSATSSNVVMLSDAGFGTLEVSGGYTIYGNGFTLTCSTDSYAADMGYSFVKLNNGTLDNVKIVCPNFSHSLLYSFNYAENNNPSVTDANGKTRYYNIRSAVLATGNNTIVNSYVSGGRVAIYQTAGTTTVDNSIICGGAVANIQVTSAASHLVLRDVSLIQKPIQANVNTTSNTVMGFSVIAMCDDSGNSTPITLEGKHVQYAWTNNDHKDYVPKTAQSIISTIMSNTDYVHTVGGKDSLNLGIAYLAGDAGVINTPDMSDNRTNKSTVVYDFVDVTYLGSTLAKVYSYKKTTDTPDESYITEPVFIPAGHESALPQLEFAGADENKVFTTEFDASVGAWHNKLTVNLDAGAYSFSFADLKLTKHGVEYDYTVLDASGSTVDKSSAISLAVGSKTYTIRAVVDGETRDICFVIVATMTEIKTPVIVESNWGAGICVASSYGGTWSGAAPALEGIKIEYWSTAESKYKTILLSDFTPSGAGKINGNNTIYTITGDDFTLVLTGGQVHSGNNVYAVPVVCEGKLYFVAASSNGLVNTGNSARSVPVSYEFKDNTGKTLKFSKTWSVAENKDAQYSYNDFCNSGKMTQLTSGGGNCITPDTLITLADGSVKRVDELKGDELLLVWNLETGKYDSAPIVFIDNEAESELDVIRLYFSDGREVGVIYEHGFFDIDLGKYVYITADNYSSYIGHRFVVIGDMTEGSWEEAVLTDVKVERELTSAWSPVTAKHLCYYTNGVLSMPGGISGLFNIFDVDTDIMMYDQQKKQADIDRYGLLTIEDYGDMITAEAFYVFNGEYLGVAVGRGLLTWEDIAYMAQRYIPLM